ncbi:phosphoglycerate mutase [Bombiscardovia apis]|uniref:phosphoglycerate mutase (2,3-diphosphoglycerate-dependent) n=1 Tax=Bombiscardovia apis TaxID=2932182 RepID=A0ABM8BAX1_9BIFI|nr:histidine phosphatase family protein [Bombiscardovia apis]BDR53988.1 phosphoglycerate mutase [Bombiscardovia apis]
MEHTGDLSGEEAEQRGCLVLLRHGETQWSRSGQYTGRTDLPLVSDGREQARAAGERLAAEFPQGFDEGYMFASPLSRAQETAALAGFPGVRTFNDLVEWDYGRAEGRRPTQVAQMLGWGWDLWSDGPQSIDESLGGVWQAPLPEGGSVVVPGNSGESLQEVAERAMGLVRYAQPMVEAGHRVLFVAHAHILRIVTTQWMGLDAAQAQRFRLDTAHYAVLSRYHGDNVLKAWNR